jgi:hypothetical protein
MTADDRFIYQAPDPDEEFGVRSEIITGPVSDWATDFSHLEPEWSADPYPIQDDLRQRCPIAHTDRFGGGWLPTRYEDVARPMREYVGERGDWLGGLVELAQARGELDPGLSPAALAHFCLLLAMGSALITPDLHATGEDEWAALLVRVAGALGTSTTDRGMAQ